MKKVMLFVGFIFLVITCTAIKAKFTATKDPNFGSKIESVFLVIKLTY